MSEEGSCVAEHLNSAILQRGFENAKAWMLELAAKNDKKQIVLGLEPTGHYWFCVGCMDDFKRNQCCPGKSICRKAKKIEDNSQLKDDRKDPKLIANLVKDGKLRKCHIFQKTFMQI